MRRLEQDVIWSAFIALAQGALNEMTGWLTTDISFLEHGPIESGLSLFFVFCVLFFSFCAIRILWNKIRPEPEEEIKKPSIHVTQYFIGSEGWDAQKMSNFAELGVRGVQKILRDVPSEGVSTEDKPSDPSSTHLFAGDGVWV